MGRKTRLSTSISFSRKAEADNADIKMQFEYRKYKYGGKSVAIYFVVDRDDRASDKRV